MTTYALQAGFKALNAAGEIDNFTVSGDCAGTAQTIIGAGVAASFEGYNGFSTSQNATLNIPVCGGTTTATGTSYYDANYARLGSLSADGSYSALVGSSLALPVSVKVGDAYPVYAVYANYQDSTKAVRTGQVIEGFAIEADTTNPSTTANTAIYHSTSKSYDTSNNLQTVQQTFYRMTPNGNLTLLSLDVQFYTLFSTHLVYTRVN